MAPRNAVAFEAKTSEEMKRPGAYQFMYQYDVENKRQTDRKVGIKHCCPCGCGGQSAIWFTGGSGNSEGCWPDHEWEVKGEWPKVTLSPSIGIGKGRGTSAGFHWHGFLEDGVWVEK